MPALHSAKHERFAQLVASVKADGVLAPLLVTPDGEGDGLRLIAGEGLATVQILGLLAVAVGLMSIVFAGAPVVNALYSLFLHPPAGGWQKLPWPFVLGLALAAAGGCLVSLYKPAPAPPGKSAMVRSADPAPGGGQTAATAQP